MRIYLTLAVLSTVYSLALSTKKGKKIADNHTAESVVIGVSLVLSATFFLIDFSSWKRTCFAFCVAGLPLWGRSLWGRFTRVEGL